MPVKEKEVIAWLSERKLMPSPELVSHISNHPEGLGLLERTVTSLTEPKLFLGISDLVEEESAEAPKPIKRKKVAEIPPVIIERQIQKSMSDGKLESYVSLFNDRFKSLSKLVRRDPSMRDAIRDTSNLSPDEENKIIGMVADIQTFNNGRTRVTLEDKNGKKLWENSYPLNYSNVINSLFIFGKNRIINVGYKLIPDKKDETSFEGLEGVDNSVQKIQAWVFDMDTLGVKNNEYAFRGDRSESGIKIMENSQSDIKVLANLNSFNKGKILLAFLMYSLSPKKPCSGLKILLIDRPLAIKVSII